MNCSTCMNPKLQIKSQVAEMWVCKTCNTREFISKDGKSLGVIPL